MATPHDLRLPRDASEDETAAIVAAVEQLLAEEARARQEEPGDGTDPWAGRRFGFAGRAAALTGRRHRVPAGAPADPWTVLGRLERR